MKEVVVDDHDVVKGLLDFANRNLVHSLVIGASTKNLMPRSDSISCEVVLLFII
jgi:hypothetical protein